MNDTAEYIYKTTLKKEYGFTDAMIAHLGEPDKHVQNPHFRSGPRASLYRRDRVLAWIEQHQAMAAGARHRLAQRNENRRLAMAAFWMHVDAVLEEIHPQASPLSDTLIRWANEVPIKIRRFQPDRISAIRHNYTNYEQLLAQLDRRPEVQTLAVLEDQVMQRIGDPPYTFTESEAYQFGERTRRYFFGRWNAYGIIRDRVNKEIEAILETMNDD